MAPATMLTAEEKEHFLSHGWLKIPSAFTRAQADAVTNNLWTRLGMSPTDKSTWTPARIHMPSHSTFDSAEFAPRAWAAICELCGGEERITPESRQWRDALIVNLGSAEAEGRPAPAPRALDNWHVDGDFFVHYLDSPEQGLLVIPLLSDVPPGGGGTVMCPAAIPRLARHLHDHPEGASPRMTPRGRPGFAAEPDLRFYQSLVQDLDGFVEAHGRCGDVFLLHPLMLHSASTNPLRNVRIITNPPVSLREPFSFDRPDGNYSLVEQATLRALGRDRLPRWRISVPRERLVPERLKVQEKMKQDELRRLEEVGSATLTDGVTATA